VQDTQIAFAFLELGSPRLPEAIDQAVTDGAKRVTVLPFFLSPGLHTSEHIPEIVAQAAALHPDCEIALGQVLGASSGILDLLETLVRQSLEEK